MASTLKINGVEYAGVKEIRVPLASDPSKEVVFPDTSDANAVAGSIKNGDSAWVKGKKVVGSMPVNGAISGKIATKDGTVSVPEGYTPGGSVAIDDTEKQKLIGSNIRKGVTVLGVEGSMSSTEGLNPQAKEVTPTKSEQVVLPDNGYNALSQVTIGAIPDKYIDTTDATAEAEHLANGETAYVNGRKLTGTHTDPTFTLANNVLTIA